MRSKDTAQPSEPASEELTFREKRNRQARARYAANPELLEKSKARARKCYDSAKATAKAKAKADENREFLWEMKKAPCLDCGTAFHPMAMEFDHVRGDKRYNIAHMARWASRAALVEELSKCELVCANCHRVRTYERMTNAKS